MFLYHGKRKARTRTELSPKFSQPYTWTRPEKPEPTYKCLLVFLVVNPYAILVKSFFQATPTSIDSFHLPAVDDVLSPDNKPIVAQHSCLSSPGALSIAPKFRPHAMSASSRRQLVAPRSQRSHSSSAPDRPRKDEAHAEHSKPLLNPSELASSLKHSAPLSLAKEAKTEVKSSIIFWGGRFSTERVCFDRMACLKNWLRCYVINNVATSPVSLLWWIILEAKFHYRYSGCILNLP